MGRFLALLKTHVAWVKSNAESMIALILAVSMSILGIVSLGTNDLVVKAIPLTLGVVAFALLRDRWRQESVNADMQESIANIDTTLKLHEIACLRRFSGRVSSRNEISYPFGGIAELANCDDVNFTRFVVPLRLLRTISSVTDVMGENSIRRSRAYYHTQSHSHHRCDQDGTTASCSLTSRRLRIESRASSAYQPVCTQ